MITIESLIDCIRSQDAFSFIRNYLLLIKNGSSLELPLSLDAETLATQWEDVVPKQCKFANKGFFEKVSKIWILILEDYHQNTEDESFVIEHVLDVIDKKYKIPEDKIHLAIRDGQVFSKSTYRKTYEDRTEIYSDEILLEHLKIGNYRLFLINMLENEIIEKSNSLPLSSVKNKIQSNWELILKQRFNFKRKNTLEKITQSYFYLANKYGVPTNDNTIKRYIERLQQSQ